MFPEINSRENNLLEKAVACVAGGIRERASARR